jgi:CRP-like cAMP-binding protein
MTYLLPSNQLFDALSERDRAAIVHFMHERQYECGDTLCTRGEQGNTMIVVLQGAVSAVVPGGDDSQREIARLGKDGVFGEMFCIDPAPRPATLVAIENTTVLELGREDLTKMRQHAPRTAAALINAVFHSVLRRLRDVESRIERDLRDGLTDDSDGARAEQTSLPDPWEQCFARLRGSA